MSRFPSEQLHTFATVVSEGTLESAARLLHLTPSAVSQRLKALEQGAGRVLLERSNPVRATEAGEVVLRLARQLSQLEADAAHELGMPDDPELMSVPIVVNADSLAVWFLAALAKIPPDLNVTFDLHRDDEQHSTSLLRSGTVMAAVTATPQPVQGCSVESLGIMRYRAVASPEYVAHWLAAGIGPEALNSAPAVDFDRKDQYQRRFIQELFGEERKQPDGGPVASLPQQPLPGPRHYVPATEQFADAIRLGLGWGLMPESQCLPGIDAGTLIELVPGRFFDVPLFWQRWRTPSRILDTVGAAVRAAAVEYLLEPEVAGGVKGRPRRLSRQ